MVVLSPMITQQRRFVSIMVLQRTCNAPMAVRFRHEAPTKKYMNVEKIFLLFLVTFVLIGYFVMFIF